MKKRTVIILILFVLLSTITPQQKITVSKFNIKEIIVENNILLEERDIKESLIKIYDKNLIFLDNKEIETALMQNSFIEGFNIKKKYPNTLKIKIFEKKPIAILFKKKKKFYLSENIELIEFKELLNFQNLLYIFGDEKKFEVIFNDLKKIQFPLNQIKKFIFFETNRWDLVTINNKIIRLPTENYMERLENYLQIKDDKNFIKYKVFDYRIKNQLILK